MQLLAQGMSWSQWFMAVLIIAVCCFLMLVILLQRGRGGGLAGAFGGSGGSSAFGAKTGDVFTWITVVVATMFLVLAVIANFVFDQTPPDRPSVSTGTTTVPIEGPLPEPGTQPSALPITVTTPPAQGDTQQPAPTSVQGGAEQGESGAAEGTEPADGTGAPVGDAKPESQDADSGEAPAAEQTADEDWPGS